MNLFMFIEYISIDISNVSRLYIYYDFDAFVFTLRARFDLVFQII